MNLTSIGYQGKATIKVLRGNKVVKTITHHNNGTSWLFKILISSLCGKDESINMPKFLNLYSTEDTSKAMILNRVPLTNKIIESKGGSETLYVASFSALIAPSLFNTSGDLKRLSLYSTATGDDELAYIIFGGDGVSLGNTSIYSLAVEWTMSFVNSTEDTTS